MNFSGKAIIQVILTLLVIFLGAMLGLSRCDPMPSEAIAAWNGPAADAKDPRLWALSYALLAPNPHDMQPWLVDLSEPGVITFYCDKTRLLPETDPYARQITIGCGAFLELLRIAAAEEGFRTDISLFPQGDWPKNQVGDQPICRIVFVKDQAVAKDPLFAQILLRRTNRSHYESTPISQEMAAKLAGAASPIPFGWTVDQAEVAKLRDIAKRAWLVEVNKDSTYYESVKVYWVTGEEIAKHNDGLSFHGPLIWWLHELGLFSKEKALAGDLFLRKESRDFVEDQIKDTSAFGWLVTKTNDRRAELEAGAAYVRVNLKATELDLAMQPLSQALQEFPEMLPVFSEMKRALGVPESSTVQMFFRIGQAPAVEPSPRRPLEQIIKGKFQ